MWNIFKKKKNKDINKKNFMDNITTISFKDIKEQTINVFIKDELLYIQSHNGKLQFVLNDENTALLNVILHDYIINGNFESIKKRLT
jgi:hypothetical protein